MPRDSQLDPDTPYPIPSPEQGMLLITAGLELSLKGSFPGVFLEGRAPFGQRSGAERKWGSQLASESPVSVMSAMLGGPGVEEWSDRQRLEEIMNLPIKPNSQHLGICHCKEYWCRITVAPFGWDLAIFLSSVPCGAKGSTVSGAPRRGELKRKVGFTYHVIIRGNLHSP